MVNIGGETLSSSRHFAVFTAVLAAVALMVSPPAAATVIDLTSGSGSGTINGAVFMFGNSPGGTGVFKQFVKIQAHGTAEGYNTSNSSVPFDEKASVWTHDMRLNEIPVIDVGGTDYFKFVLDINEARGGKEFLSLDNLYLSCVPKPVTILG